MIYGSRLFCFNKSCTFARMFRTDHFRKFFSVLVSALYLFVVLFSQEMHHHGSSYTSKDTATHHFTKSFSDGTVSSDASQCLSCQFFFTGNSLVPQDFVFSVYTARESIQKYVAYDMPVVVAEASALFLRGPPVATV